MTLPKGVHRVVKTLADGKQATYYYWRSPRTRLPDDPNSIEFQEAIDRIRKAPEDAPRVGTMGALVIDYRRSPNFQNLRPSTKRNYERAMEQARGLNGVAVQVVKRAHFMKLRDVIALTAPSLANTFSDVMSLLMRFAIERELRESNPCAGIKRLKMGHYPTWSEDQITHALAVLPEQFRRALLLALYTGQREGDCCAMRWSQYDGSAIRLTQQKTRTALWIPVHKKLRGELDKWRLAAAGPMILKPPRREAWKAETFATLFSRQMQKDPKLKGMVFHGLRKAAAVRLAEAGCSTHEIAAITGHRTLAMVDLYTRGADQKRQATTAMARLELVGGKDAENPVTDSVYKDSVTGPQADENKRDPD